MMKGVDVQGRGVRESGADEACLNPKERQEQRSRWRNAVSAQLQVLLRLGCRHTLINPS